nr:hypothetical protein [Endozoicomonas sp.]
CEFPDTATDGGSNSNQDEGNFKVWSVQVQVQVQVEKFLLVAIVNIKGRKQSNDTRYIHQQPAKWKTIKMKEEYIAKDLECGAKYFTKDERANYEINFHEGRIYIRGKLITDQKSMRYVMDGDGTFYIDHNLDSSIRSSSFHSTFLAGTPIAAAGILKIDKDGYIILIDNSSGHYTPEPDNLDQAVKEICSKGGGDRLALLLHGWFEAFTSSSVGNSLYQIFSSIQEQFPVPLKSPFIYCSNKHLGKISYKLFSLSQQNMPEKNSEEVFLNEKKWHHKIDHVLSDAEFEFKVTHYPVLKNLELIIEVSGRKVKTSR